MNRMAKDIQFKVEQGRVFVPVGEACPFACKYCYTRDAEIGPSRATVDEILRRLHTFASEQTFETIQFGYDGDPFARPDRGITMLQRMAGMGKGPRGTSHTCPRCGKPAKTYRSARAHHRIDPVKWGCWLVCSHCSYSADRDYYAAVNIARLGVAFLTQMQIKGKAQACSVTDEQSVEPCPYRGDDIVPSQIPAKRFSKDSARAHEALDKSIVLRYNVSQWITRLAVWRTCVN
jgi:hypothetical protein